MKKKIIIHISIVLIVVFLLTFQVFSGENDSQRLIFTDYKINNDSSLTVPAGNFTLNYTLENKSKLGISNAVLSYDQKNLLIVPVPGSSNTEYIGNIAAGEKYNGSIELFIPKYADAGICKFDITIIYNSSDPAEHSDFSSQFSIYLNIENNTELSIENVELSDEAAAGGRKRLWVEYENPGSIDFKNLTLVINGNIGEQQKVQILPILKAGKSNSIEYYIQFTQTGEQKLDVHIAYEDDSGNSYKTPVITKQTEVTAESAVQPTPAPQTEGYISKIIRSIKDLIKSPSFAVAIVILIIISIGAAVIIPYIRKKRKKKNWYYKNKNGG